MSVMPAAFVGHGSPMNALDDNRWTRAWRALGAAVPRPRAVLVVSAHWYVESVAVTAMAVPRTIHDFYGFPPELFAVRYDAPGAPDVALEVAEIARPREVLIDREAWGLDHGAWSVLLHAFPEADVPVVQLSIQQGVPLESHLELGAALAPLRESGVLVLCSGNVVHHLGAIDWRRPEGGHDWARRFDDAASEILATSPADVLALRDHPDWRMAVPTPDHFIPLLYLAGLARAANRPLAPFVEGLTLGSISMAGYALDEGGRLPLPSRDEA